MQIERFFRRSLLFFFLGSLCGTPCVLADDPMSGSMSMNGMEMDHGKMEDGESGRGMHSMYGDYPMARDASGTSWQPESTPMEGLHLMKDDWMFMVHGSANAVYDDQGGKRGKRDVFGENMLAGMAQHPWGIGTWGFRGMLSLEPLTIGKHGYPLLLQTGETPDGAEHFIDRQHAHDLLMELATTYSVPLSSVSSAFIYLGLPGEPALGPPVFMHRFSGMDNPEAPITHHWLDSTHITYGVVTLGYLWKQCKIEVSGFNGREPDQYRWGFDTPRINSVSTRISYNPTPHWALQTSFGRLKSPEQLEPNVNTYRWTTSAVYDRPWKENHWQTTLAWGENLNVPGRSLSGFLLESAVNFRHTHTFFLRAESVDKDELFREEDPQFGRGYWVNKLSAGYLYDLPPWKYMQWGIGAVGSMCFFSGPVQEAYGDLPLSYMLFVRTKIV